MNITRKLKSALMPVAVAAAATMAPGVASADAVAQAILGLSKFSIIGQNNVDYSVVVAVDSGDVSASINGGVPATDTFNGLGTFTLNKAVGPNAGSYAPMTPLLGAPTGNYVGSFSFLNGGNPQNGDVIAQVDNTVSLTPGGTGTAQSNVNLNATFDLIVGAPGSIFDLTFDAASFLRAMLVGSPGTELEFAL